MRESLSRRRERLALAGAQAGGPPLEIVRGEGVWLWDAAGGRYLDAATGTAVVGHCHPGVVEAVRRQAARPVAGECEALALDLIERLGATLPAGLSQALLVNSGSEANDIALSMARAATGRRGIVAVEGAAHGYTAALVPLTGRGEVGGGPAAQVRLVAAPETASESDAGDAARRFASGIALAIADLEDLGIGFAGLILTPDFADLGPDALPEGFLAPTQALVRRAGGLLIADEGRSGFGRLGSHFWGHARAGVTPDVVTMGAAMANGHAAGAAFARADVVAAFRDALGIGGGFGGNPVAAAAALATLDVLEKEGLQHHAARTGNRLREVLGAVRHPLLRGVRGTGLALSLEIAGDAAIPPQLVEALRGEGLLTAAIGPRRNLLRIAPPLSLGRGAAERVDPAWLGEALSRALRRVGDAAPA